MIFLESVKMAAKQELDYFLQIKSDKSQKGRRHPNMDIQITEYSSNVTRKSVFLWLLINLRCVPVNGFINQSEIMLLFCYYP